MIVANLATYPPRRAALERVIQNLAPQVDLLNIVLNEYTKPPDIVALPENVRFIVPSSDLKDTGKFYPSILPDDVVFFVDDDILYPVDYVQRTLSWLKCLPHDRFVVGYHGSVYLRRPYKERLHAWLSGRQLRIERHIVNFADGLDRLTVVDQLGSGTLAMYGRYVPSFSYMMGSQKFVDVRLARWCYSNKLTSLCLAREAKTLQAVPFDETIFESFTLKFPENVTKEIRTFAFKRRNVGTALDYA